MHNVVYNSESLILFTEAEPIRFVTETCSENVLRMELWAQKDFCADRFSVKLSLQNGTPQEIAQHFHFIPTIKHKKENICGAHVFRSPTAILSNKDIFIAMVPDMHSMKEDLASLAFMDMRFDPEDKIAPYLEFGLIRHRSENHVFFSPTGEPLSVPKGTVLPFYILIFKGLSVQESLFRTASFLFNTYSEPYTASSLPQTVPFDTYARYGNTFGESMYWENEEGGGIPLTTFLKKDGSYSGREYADDLFFHCWFNNMRTARELYDFGKRLNCEKWVHMADQIKKLLLSAPQNDGVFPTIYAPHDGGWIGSSNHGGGPEYCSLPDCAWTAYQLMLYERQSGQTENGRIFLQNLANGLLHRVRPDSTFPVWEKNKYFTQTNENAPQENRIPVEQRLLKTTSNALCALFLAEYALAFGGEEYKTAAVNCMEYITENCLPQQKFEDFELYYSCSPKNEDFYDGISRMYGQNTLAMQWTAEAYLALYKLTAEEKYLACGRYALDLMTLYQQVWNPPFLSLYTFGGFGVMNTDGEWNDARQAQFAETLANYYDATGEKIYFQRAVAALRASFTLMVMEENAQVSPTISPREYLNEIHGGMAENYGHEGSDSRAGQSGFHWGSGSALVTAAELKRRYGDVIEFTPINKL